MNRAFRLQFLRTQSGRKRISTVPARRNATAELSTEQKAAENTHNKGLLV